MKDIRFSEALLGIIRILLMGSGSNIVYNQIKASSKMGMCETKANIQGSRYLPCNIAACEPTPHYKALRAIADTKTSSCT
jgi:hypothetical protein